jgi:exo-1,4-beta-D-glucosaminidase
MLRHGWQVQTSTGQPDGAVVSKVGFAAAGWYPTTVPATVSGVLAHAGAYPDPFVGTNLRDWPGMRRGPAAAGAPQNNPFSVGWWFRIGFDLPQRWQGGDPSFRALTIADVRSPERIADHNWWLAAAVST